MVRCTECGAESAAGAKFCAECGARLGPAACASCGAALTPGAKFCAECGTPVAVGLAVIAGLCSIARLRPSIRNPARTEVQDEVPTLKTTR